jgi:integrase
VPRRRFQTGCLKLIGHSWTLLFWEDQNRDGIIQRVKVSKKIGGMELSPRQARKLAQPILDEVNNQTDIPFKASRNALTFATFVEQWRVSGTLDFKPSTKRALDSSIRAHLIPQLGQIPITLITIKHVQDLIGTMLHRSRGTRENVVDDLFRILEEARRVYPGVPTLRKRDLKFGIKKAGEGKPFVFTPAQVKKILEAFAGRKTWDCFFTLLALTGLRASEILGLRVEDVDFDNNQIHVRQAAWHGQIQTVKTDESENCVPMTPLMREKLLRHLEGHSHHLLFVNSRNRPYSRNKVVSTVLHPVLDRLGISRKGRRVGLHGFRHTLASMLLQSTGVTVAQQQLRHADAATTLGYGHVLGDAQREAMDAIESVFLGQAVVSPVVPENDPSKRLVMMRTW